MTGSLPFRRLIDVEDLAVTRVTTSRSLPVFAGMLAGLVGPSETGKSLLAGHMLLDVTQSGGRALLVDGEMSARAWRSRLRMLGADRSQLERVYYAEMSEGAADVEAVRDAVATVGAGLVVWDSALSLISRTCMSENSNAEVGRVFDRLRDIVRDGPAGLIVDHSAAAALSPVSRGASAKFAAFDLSYGIRLADGAVPSRAATWSSIVSVEKDRHGVMPGRTDHHVTVVPINGGAGVEIDVAAAGSSSHRLAAASPLAAAVAKIAALSPPPTSANEAYKLIGGTRTTALRAFRDWSERGSGGSGSLDPNHRTTSTEPVRTTRTTPCRCQLCGATSELDELCTACAAVATPVRRRAAARAS